jgi:hypothetical protein
MQNLGSARHAASYVLSRHFVHGAARLTAAGTSIWLPLINRLLGCFVETGLLPVDPFSVTMKVLVRGHGNAGQVVTYRSMRTGVPEPATVDQSSGDCARSRLRVITVMICEARAEPSDGSGSGLAQDCQSIVLSLRVPGEGELHALLPKWRQWALYSGMRTAQQSRGYPSGVGPQPRSLGADNSFSPCNGQFSSTRCSTVDRQWVSETRLRRRRV